MPVPMYEVTARQIEMIKILQSSKFGYTIKEVQRKLNEEDYIIGERQVRRDIEQLEAIIQAKPIIGKDTQSRAKTYRLEQGFNNITPAAKTELAGIKKDTMALALELLVQNGYMGMAYELNTLLTAGYGKLDVLNKQQIDVAQHDAYMLEEIKAAIEDKDILDFKTKKGTFKAVPQNVVVEQGAIYVVTNYNKNFRLALQDILEAELSEADNDNTNDEGSPYAA